MDPELVALLKDAATADETFDWTALARALRRRGHPALPDDLAETRAREARLLETCVALTPSVLEQEATRLFARHEALTEFSWRQYTPYWCDGDACSFNAWTNYADINGVDEYSLGDPALEEALADVRRTLRAYRDDELLLRLFGDHKVVRVTREGVFVEFYEHEF